MAALEYGEVKRRVIASHSEVVDELYDFGQRLVNDAVDRLAKLDVKASGLAAYSGGIVTIWISTSAIWEKLLSPYSLVVALSGILTFMLAAWLAVGGSYPQETRWFSDNDWFRAECLQEREQLRRYRVLTMWEIVTSHQAACRMKTRRIHQSILAMKIAFVLLLVTFFDVAWRYASLQDLWIWIR